MKLSRREFLMSGSAAAAAALVPSPLLAALQRSEPKPDDLSSWPAVRAQFALAPEYLHFSSFFLASHPRPVREAIERLRRELDANPLMTIEHRLFESEEASVQMEVRRRAAAYLGTRPEEIALTSNTTSGLAMVYNGLTLERGDELLLTTHDHYVHHETARLVAARTGARLRKVPLFDRSAEANVAGIVGSIRAALRPETRVLGVTWVHSSTGVRLPIREIAEVVRAANRNRKESERILLVVDGVHGLGCVDETVGEMGCDFFCSGTHKWIFAPRGTGIVWAKPENWARLRPNVPAFEFDLFEAWMQDKPPGPTTAAHMSPGGFLAYEHQWAMGEAFRFHERIGRTRVAARIRELNDQLKAGLVEIPGVTVHTPLDPVLAAGITCFELQGKKVDDVVKRLHERKVVASSSPYAVSYVRLAPSLVNDPREVEAALREVRAIAAA